MTALQERKVSLDRSNGASSSLDPRSIAVASTGDVAGTSGGGSAPSGGVTTTMMYRYRATSSAEEVHVTQTTVHPPRGAPNDTPSPTACSEQGGPRAASRFHFVADTRAPSELQRLERETLRRRQEFKEKVREMEYQIAGWTARLANETLARDREWEDLVHKASGQPLEDAVERVMGRIEEKLVSPLASVRPTHGNDSKDDTSNFTLQDVDARVRELDAAHLDHVHKAAYEARVNHLDSIRTKIRDEAYPLLRLEAAKTDKREGGMVRTFESIAASAAHAMAEENAARVADLQLLEGEVEGEVKEKTMRDEKRIDEFLQEIRRMRGALEEERKERQASDEKVLEHIIATREVLQRTVLETLGEA
uniref:Uncharacterized protein n=1 Tax=Odontella aurita TaxID=265563 RepID=A0A7S4HNK3_9STRA|mmetsp:Transcript_12792/g.37608  ORF Transcript_12792/g.37608 Transcript_12792/m.37608 type:complete len:364 (+) Transcript_12792:75-1166(+)